MSTLKNRLIRSIVLFSRTHNIPRRNAEGEKPSRILIVTTTGIGDTLWGTPAIRSLRESLPHVRISVLTNPAGFEVLRGNPDINRFFLFRRGLRGALSLPALLVALIRSAFDTVLIFHASDRIIWPLCALTGATEVIGTAGQSKGLDFVLSKAVEQEPCEHGIVTRLNLVRKTGTSRITERLVMHLADEEKERAACHLKAQGIASGSTIVGLHPGAQKPFKCWPPSNFIELGKALRRATGCALVVTGSSNERELVRRVASSIEGAVPLAGLSLRSTSASIQQMDLFVTNDTGPMHISFALGTPTIALFSPTDPRLCGPHHAEMATVISRPVTCDPCSGKSCMRPLCMKQITVEEVMSAALSLLEAGQRDSLSMGIKR